MFAVVSNSAVDWITTVFISTNVAIVGTMAVFSDQKLVFWMAQFVVVITGIIVGMWLWLLPFWTTWLLLITIVLYDIFAVLAICGPLRLLAKSFMKMETPIPGLVFDAKRMELGVGDFIFFTQMVARAAGFHWMTAFTTSMGLLMGNIMTSFYLLRYKRMLPALPIGIVMGGILYFGTREALIPFVYTVFAKGIVL